MNSKYLVMLALLSLTAVSVVMTAPTAPTDIVESFRKLIDTEDSKCHFPPAMALSEEKLKICATQSDKQISESTAYICRGILDLHERVCNLEKPLPIDDKTILNRLAVSGLENVTKVCNSPDMKNVFKEEKCTDVCSVENAYYPCELYITMLDSLYDTFEKTIRDMSQVHYVIHHLEKYFPFPPHGSMDQDSYLSPCEKDDQTTDVKELCGYIKQLALTFARGKVHVDSLAMFQNITSPTDWDPCLALSTAVQSMNETVCTIKCKDDTRKICKSIAYGIVKWKEAEYGTSYKSDPTTEETKKTEGENEVNPEGAVKPGVADPNNAGQSQTPKPAVTTVKPAGPVTIVKTLPVKTTQKPPVVVTTTEVTKKTTKPVGAGVTTAAVAVSSTAKPTTGATTGKIITASENANTTTSPNNKTTKTPVIDANIPPKVTEPSVPILKSTMNDIEIEESEENGNPPPEANEPKGGEIPPPSQPKENDSPSNIVPNEATGNSYDDGGKELDAQLKGTGYSDESTASGGVSFMSYFLVFLVLCVAGYIVFHNKQKIIALVIEGKNGQTGRRPATKDYRRLKTDDVMPSLEKTATSTNYVY